MSEEFDKLALDLTEVAELLPGKVRQAVQQTAIRTKTVWQDAASAHPLGQQYSGSIDYEVRKFGAFGQVNYAAEVGPNLTRYGGLTGKGGLVPSAGFLDDPISSAGVETPPIHAARDAKEFAEEDLPKGIEIAVEQTLRGKNL